MKILLPLMSCALLAHAALAQRAATFMAPTGYSTGAGSAPVGIVVADLNADSKPDVLTANYSNSTVAVLLGTGTGALGAATSYSTGAGSVPYFLAVADVNADGRPDVLTANTQGNSIGVLLNTGTGTLGTVAAYSTGVGSYPRSLVVADVNTDGRPDVVFASPAANLVGVLLGTGTGGFGAATTYSVAPSGFPYGLVVADVSGDGRLDVATASGYGSTVSVLLGTAAKTFGPATTYSTGAGSQSYGLAVADVNQDGLPDLLTANTTGNGAAVLLGTGAGAFGAATTYSSGAGSLPRGIAVADANGDTQPDLVLADYGTGTADVLLGTGTGTFGTVTTYGLARGSQYSAIAAADLNGDGKPDLLTTDENNSVVRVLLNTTVLATRPALPGTSATLSPNPATAATTLLMAGVPPAVRLIEATLYNTLGQAVRRLLLPATAGSTQAAIATASLPAGIYLLRLSALDAQGAALGALPTQRLVVE